MQIDTLTPKINLLLGWLWILLSFGTGMILGLFFHRENWLGGYTSLKRRMYRLGHISLAALGALNLLFYFTVLRTPMAGPLTGFSSWMFVVGTISMPVCCLVMANYPAAHLIFAIPVVSLLAAAVSTLLEVIKL